MSFPINYPVVPKSYVERYVIDDDNQAVGYKWYQSSPSSDVLAASPCNYGCQNQVGTPILFSHEYEPPPTNLSISYASELPAYKLFDTSSEREFVFALPYTLTCHTTLSTGQLYYAIESTHPLTTPCSTSPSMSSDKYECHEALQISEADVIIGDGSKLVEKVVEVRKELVVDDVEVETQLFDEIPVRNSNSLVEKVSGDALDITTQGTDKIIQTTDRILLQMEEIKHLLLAMYPPSKRGEVITTHKADPTPVDGDPLVIQATEVEVAPLGDNFEFRTTNPEESLLKEEVKASNLKGAINGIAGILEDVFETGSSLKELAEIGNTKMIENFVRKTDERLGTDRLFVVNYRVEIVSDMLAIDSIGIKESRDKSGKEGGVADEEEVLVPVNSAEQSFTAHTFVNGLDKWYASTGKKNMLSFDPGGATINVFLSTAKKGILELVSKIYIMSIIPADEMLKRDTTIRNLMAYGFCKSCDIELGLQYFREMPEWPIFSVNSMSSGVAPQKWQNGVSFSKVFNSPQMQETKDATIFSDLIVTQISSSSLEFPLGGKLHPAGGWDEGNLVEKWTEKLQNERFMVADISNGFSYLLAVKDIAEITNVKRAACLTSAVMKLFVVPKLEQAINALKPGRTAGAAYQAAISIVEKEAPELPANLTRTAGTGIGLEFRESDLNLNGNNDRILEAGMVFNVSLGFQNLQTGTKHPKIQNISLMLADTIVIGENDLEVLTSMTSKAARDAGALRVYTRIGLTNICDFYRAIQIIEVYENILDRKAKGGNFFWAIQGGSCSNFRVILSRKLNRVDVPAKLTIFIVVMEEKQPEIMQWKQEVGSVDFVQYQQQTTGSVGSALDEFKLCESHVLPKVHVAKNMVMAWCWCDVKLVFDPGGCDYWLQRCFQSSHILEDNDILRGMDCNKWAILEAKVVLGH